MSIQSSINQSLAIASLLSSQDPVANAKREAMNKTRQVKEMSKKPVNYKVAKEQLEEYNKAKEEAVSANIKAGNLKTSADIKQGKTSTGELNPIEYYQQSMDAIEYDFDEIMQSRMEEMEEIAEKSITAEKKDLATTKLIEHVASAKKQLDRVKNLRDNLKKQNKLDDIKSNKDIIKKGGAE